MKREAIPEVGMPAHATGKALPGGCVVEPFEESRVWNPALLHPHYHDFFQVSLLLGEAHLMHDFRETDTTGSTLFFLSPGEVHAVRTRRRIAGTVISFTREFFEAGPAGGTLLLDLPFFYATDTVPWLQLDRAAGKEAADLCAEIAGEFDRMQTGAAEVLRSLLTILMVKSMRWYEPGPARHSGNRATSLVRDFQQMTERHFREGRSLDFYAKKLGVTANHLNDIVRDTTGHAAGEHLRRRRLLSAKRQLLHSELSVAEIGYFLGFKDPSYFGRFFRRYEGRSPAEFRMQIREKYHQEPE